MRRIVTAALVAFAVASGMYLATDIVYAGPYNCCGTQTCGVVHATHHCDGDEGCASESTFKKCCLDACWDPNEG
jgi:hypothetical protein